MSTAQLVHDEESQLTARDMKVAYVMSRFPKLTETFVFCEILALQRQGVEVEIYPLLRARNTASHPEGASVWRKACELLKRPQLNAVMHAEASELVEQAHFTPLLSWSIIAAQFAFLFSKPAAYLGALTTLIRANLGSANFLLGGLASFPKAVYFAREMQRSGVMHVHAHFANHPTTTAYVIHRLTGIPYTFTAHGADIHVDQHMLSEKVTAAARVVTVSTANRDFIVEVCGPDATDKIDVVRCGVDTEVFHPPLDRNAAADQPLTIVCNGTFYEVKGHRYLLEACRLLQQRGVDFRCQLIGVGPLMEEMQKLAADEGIEEHVQFLGRLTRHDVAATLRRATVLVAPSVPASCGRREGIPVVLMEGMASGLPVVASNISGIPELVEDGVTGFLVPPRDPAALADTLQAIVRDPERAQQLAEAGQARIAADYDLYGNAAKLSQTFAEWGT